MILLFYKFLNYTFYLSISPKTISIVPIIDIKSCKDKPFILYFNHSKLLYEGDLILHKKGSEFFFKKTEQPNIPLGDST